MRRSELGTMAAMLTIWRRHAANCKHREKGRDYLKCSCPIWADGYVNGKRTLRQSLKTRDMVKAWKRAADLENPDKPTLKPIRDAVRAFLDHCESETLRGSTIRKYKNTLSRLMRFCEGESIEAVSELTADHLDKFRAGRRLKPITSSKELQLLRQFLAYCEARKWTGENAAKRIKPPRNIQQNDVEPFLAGEVAAIIAACDSFGRTSYERLRARAMILTLRYTALRIGDVAMLERSRISGDGRRWRVFLRTEKSGKPVFLPIPQDLKDALEALPVPRGGEPDCRHFFWNGLTSERSAKGIAERTLSAVFRKSGVQRAHAHRFRHTLATELLGRGASFEDVADILGNSPVIVRKHYAKWSPARQARIDDLMERVHVGTNWAQTEEGAVIQ